ncbi:MAG: fluoride efflux transporter CrcB [Anaerolineales bacterium]|nr:fluoride efflux transporter CrcB [Anaerolineales bacterium]
MQNFLVIGVGAFLGANLRYRLSGWAAGKWGTSFPHGTLIINVSGSFLLGVFLALTTERILVDPRWRLFFAVGFLGAYTTFSTYTYESVQMILDGNWGLGLLNLLGSNALGILAAAAGIALGRRV